MFSLLTHIASFLFIPVLLRSKKTPGNISAWLLFIFLIPCLAIPFYFLFGNRKFKRNISTIKEDANCPISLNRRVDLLSTGELAFTALLALVDSAKEEIHLSTFIYCADSVGLKLLEILTLKAQSGVKVRLLIDSMGSFLGKRPDFRKYLLAGGSLAYSMPILRPVSFWRSNLRSHRKMLIVDTSRAMIGGMNISESYFSSLYSNHCWLDLALYLDGPAVNDLQNLFVRDWVLATNEKIGTGSRAPIPGSNQVQIISSGPMNIEDQIYDFLLSKIYAAKKLLWIATPYFIPDDCLAKALIFAAKRGVDVKILLPRKSNHSLADLARAGYLRELAGHGCHIYFFPTMLHAKAFLVDDETALIGSANFDMRSLLYNFEVGACLLSKEGIDATRNWFLSNFTHCSTNFPASGFCQELLEGFGRVLGPLI